MRYLSYLAASGLAAFALWLALGLAGGDRLAADEPAPEAPRADAREHPLPPPSSLPLPEYEKQLHAFVVSRAYATELGWCADKRVRDTGPWVKGQYHGTHPAVRVYYSPRVMYWLTGDPGHWPEGKVAGVAPPRKPREGAVPDGGMIVKEMFAPPAARHAGLSQEALAATLQSRSSPGWTVMVKDSGGSRDGWFWGSVWVGQSYDDAGSVAYPASGFGVGCLRCHAVAERESTFSSTRNIAGFPGEPITYLVDDTWRADLASSEMPWAYTHGPAARPAAATPAGPPRAPDPEFLATYSTMAPVRLEEFRSFPPESLDHVVAPPGDPSRLVTSDQCLMCHGGASSAYGFGPIMFLETEQGGINVSPYGEWRWSPMGLAGRDPVFHAQLESERAILRAELPPEQAKLFGAQTVNTCLRCHGVLGKRQHDLDQGVGPAYWDKRASFDLDWFFRADTADPHARYGAQGRDGISCLVCHQMDVEDREIGSFLRYSITGQFRLGAADQVNGPFQEVAPLAMRNALGLTPRYRASVQSSRLCGSCHTINLPVVDWPLSDPPDCEEAPPEEIATLGAADPNPHFQPFRHKLEQVTYLEWLNSAYQNEIDPPGEAARTCQDCHMPTGYRSLDGSVDVDPLQTRIAVIEDESYPEVDHRAARKEITVRLRESGYRRHTLQGLNVFLMEMVRQFPDVLGLRRVDYETGVEGLQLAIDGYVQQAQESTARIEIPELRVEGGVAEARVKVTNRAGHRLPSGVGFRRAFIELLVLDTSGGRERVVWASGRTSGVGALVDGEGRVLPSELLTPSEAEGAAGQDYQPHHQVIDSEEQVQIYEELTRNAQGRFTTSFLHRACEVKDNRLLPRGWTEAGPSPDLPRAFIAATHPGPGARQDPDYADGSGSDTVTYRATLPAGVNPEQVQVRATLYWQAWAPYYLAQRFTGVEAGARGEARRRLYYLASHLALDGTPIADWKLELASATATVAGE